MRGGGHSPGYWRARSKSLSCHKLRYVKASLAHPLNALRCLGKTAQRSVSSQRPENICINPPKQCIWILE